MHLQLSYNMENETNLNRGLNGFIFPGIKKTHTSAATTTRNNKDWKVIGYEI